MRRMKDDTHLGISLNNIYATATFNSTGDEALLSKQLVNGIYLFVVDNIGEAYATQIFAVTSNNTYVGVVLNDGGDYPVLAELNIYSTTISAVGTNLNVSLGDEKINIYKIG